MAKKIPKKKEIKARRDWLAEIFLVTWRPYLWIGLAGFLVYWPTVNFGFVGFDDKLLIVDNYAFISDFANILQAFSQDVFRVGLHQSSEAYYRPMFTLSLMVDAKIGGSAPWIYHLTNIFFHILAAGLVFKVLNRLGYQRETAFFFSLIFTVHPILTQAVAWIPGRNDSLLAIFVLAALIAWIRFWEKREKKYLYGHLFFFLLALLTKEAALLLPVLCVLYLLLLARKPLWSLGNYLPVLGWAGVILVWYLLRSAALHGGQTPVPPAAIARYLLDNLPVIIQYIGKIFFPVRLSVLPTIRDVPLSYGLVSIILVTICLVLSKNRRPAYLIFGAAWFLLFLLPSLLVPIFVGLEHRIYLALVGFFLLLLEIDPIKHAPGNFKARAFLALLIVVLLPYVTVTHSRSFNDEISFWENAVHASPHSALARVNLGAKYFARGRVERARQEYQKALEINPREPMAHNNLGVIYAGRKMLPEAEAAFRKELEVNPTYDDAHVNLGLVLAELGDPAEAQRCWRQALALNPNNLRALNQLAFYAYQQHDLPQAAFYLKELQKRQAPVPPGLLKVLNLNGK